MKFSHIQSFERPIWKNVVDTWDYEKSLVVIRELFKSTDKYKNGKNAGKAFRELIKEWEARNLGPIKWPCTQGQFETLVQELNNRKISGDEKDSKVSISAIQYRRMKELNTARNDFLEFQIFERNKNILPTLKHIRAFDYFIDGEAFDQKVAASPTTQFKEYYGSDWKQKAKNNPDKVAEFLYTYQSEERFGADNRLLIVYLDDDVSIEKVETALNSVNFNSPLKVPFTFQHRNAGPKHYVATCFVILLSNS